MIKLLGLEGIFQALGVLYLLIVIGAVTVAVWLGRTKVRKFAWAAGLLLVLTAPISIRVFDVYQSRQQYVNASTLFQERCKAAGERVSETVRNVEGVLLMKPRPASMNLFNQFALDDPYGRDFGGDHYVRAYLMGRNADGSFTGRHTNDAYRFVEMRDTTSGQLLRYTAVPVDTPGALPFDLELKREAVQQPLARYGVTWDDISTTEDRNNWIAGSRLEIIELATNRVIAERIGYMFDKGLGDKSNGRSPWSYAEYTACPPFERSESGHPVKSSRGRGFVLRVVQPISGR